MNIKYTFLFSPWWYKWHLWKKTLIKETEFIETEFLFYWGDRGARAAVMLSARVVADWLKSDFGADFAIFIMYDRLHNFRI